MIRIDDSLLQELGLMVLPKEERDALLTQIYETLEMRVGMKLAERMTDQQLDEFEAFLPNEQTGSAGDEEGALRWLETNFPDYKQVVADELEKLKTEIKRDSQHILQNSAARQQNAPDQLSPRADNLNPQDFGSSSPQTATPFQPPVDSSSSQPPQFPPPPTQSQSPYDQNQQPPMAA